MATRVFSSGPQDSLASAERLMSQWQVHRLPVVDADNHPIGLISMNDIARKVAASPKRKGAEHDVVHTIAAICEPRPLVKAKPTTQHLAQAAD
jgi:CBS domain-containing protein